MPRFKYEYVTSTVSLRDNEDVIVVDILNDSDAGQSTQVVIYLNTGTGATTVAESDIVTVIPTWKWRLAFPVTQSGDYWLRIRATSKFLIPKASFERLQESLSVPIVSYHPGDFAVFKSRLYRRRLW